MTTQIPLVSPLLVFSSGTYGFQEVLDTFPTAKHVNIATFNITTEFSHLLHQLQRVPDSCPVRIVSNIPRRWEAYTSPRARNNARLQIKAYTAQLNPRTLPGQVSVFFNFNSHCKIVSTDSVMYIGSANYSDASKENFECGVIIRDPQAIKRVTEEVFAPLVRHGVEFTDSVESRLLFQCSELRDTVTRFNSELNNYLHPQVRAYWEYDEVPDYSHAPFSRSKLDELQEVVRDITGFTWELEKHPALESIASEFSAPITEALENLVTSGGAIRDFAEADDARAQTAYIERNSILYDDPADPQLYDDAANAAGEARDELWEKAQDDLKRLSKALEWTRSRLDHWAGRIAQADLPHAEFDNTR